MKLLGNFTHGHSTETGCCEPFKYRMRQSHRSLHEREVRRYRNKEKRALASEIQDELVEAGYQLQSLDDYRREYYSSWFILEDLDDSNFIIEEIQEMKLTFDNINYYPAA